MDGSSSAERILSRHEPDEIRGNGRRRMVACSPAVRSAFPARGAPLGPAGAQTADADLTNGADDADRSVPGTRPRPTSRYEMGTAARHATVPEGRCSNPESRFPPSGRFRTIRVIAVPTARAGFCGPFRVRCCRVLRVLPDGAMR